MKLGPDRCNECHEQVTTNDRYILSGLCERCEDKAFRAEYDTEDDLDRMILLQADFNGLYSQRKLIGLATYGIHITPGYFKKTFGVGSDVIREASAGRIKCKKSYKGTEFFALFEYPDEKDVQTIEL